MGRTRIELLTSGDIDMYDDVSAPLTYAVADVRHPDKRNASFSKTIKVPATKGNNIRFGHIFDVNLSETTYNPNIKAPCTLYIDDVPQLKGYLQILSIQINDKGKMEYSISIQGNVGNIFGDLGDSYLEDIDLSAFDHTLDRATQEAAWNNDFNDGYCYPLIDFGYDNNINQYKVEHLIPSVFLRTYIDKIFEDSGYTYTSNFFDSERFRNLLIPCNTQEFKLTQAQELARLFEANLNAYDTAFHSYSPTVISGWQRLTMDNEVNDPANAYNPALSVWTVPQTGYYDLTSTHNLNTSGTITYGASPPSQTMFAFLGIRKLSGATYSILGSTNTSLNSSAKNFTVSATNVFLQAGDFIDVCITDSFGANAVPNSLLIEQNVASGVSFKNSAGNNGALQAGDSVTMNNLIPRKIKQKDLLLDIIRMFGLYVEVDEANDKHLLIDTRDDFYASGSIVDWTYKLDNSKPLEVKPMGDLQFKNFKYSYKSDKDFYNKKSEEDYKFPYGNRDYVTENEFLKSTNETKVMFSPTPLVADTGDDRIIPRIYEVDSSNNVKNKPTNIRLLYRGGRMITTKPYDWVDSSATSGTISYSEYLYAGHLDNPSSPTFDLSFAPPREVYYDTSVYTDGNVFNEYHRKHIEEITDKDSKIVIGYFYLTLLDIAQLDFRNKFYFENQNWRLNKIYDYNPISSEVTKCEFIKIKEGAPYTATTGYIGDSVLPDGTFLGDDEPSPTTVDVGRPRSTTIHGNSTTGGNLRNGIINGNDNAVGDGENIVILNSSGCTVLDGLENVILINTSGTVVDQSNTIIIGGVDFSNISETAGVSGAKYKQVEIDYSVEVGDSSIYVVTDSGDVNITLPSPSDMTYTFDGETYSYIIHITKIRNDSNTVYVLPNGSETIIAESSLELTEQAENVTLVTDGTNYYER